MPKLHINSCLTLVFLVFLLALKVNPSSSESGEQYVRDACSVTRYQDLCVRSLSPFSAVAKNSPSKWARAAVSVTITEAKSAEKYLNKTRRLVVGKRNRIALSDCLELFQDAIDELHRSLGVLRKLKARAFQEQMSDLLTWLSAVLTDEDTCLDGFEGGGKGRRMRSTVRLVRRRVLNATYVTSNALALVNKLATTGL